MKIKILKKEGVVAMDTRNSKEFKHYEEGTCFAVIFTIEKIIKKDLN